MRAKPLDLRRCSEKDLALRLGDPNVELREAACLELGARGEKRGWEAYGLLTQDPELARLFVSPKDPFEAVGVVVGEATYQRVRDAWPSAVERTLEPGRRELTIDFRNVRLDVMTLGLDLWASEGDAAEGREGLGEVELRVSDVNAFSARVDALEGDLKARVVLLPRTPLSPEGESRFVLAHVRDPRGARTVLVQLTPAEKSKPAR